MMITRRIAIPVIAYLFLSSGDAWAGGAADPGRWASLAADGFPEVFAWTDTCNVYALRDGDAAVLIDLGDGDALDHLGEIGVTRVEWVLFTHHHREQCQGAPRLEGTGAKVGGPSAERALFENPTSFRKMKPSLDDAFTVHGASYVRPPIRRIPLDRAFARMDEFAWRGHRFRCLETKGDSPGGMSYFLQLRGKWIAFSGDVMCDGARMHTYFDSEWDYGFAAGLHALIGSAATVAGFDPSLLLPSHGPIVRGARRQLEDYGAKLRRLERMVVRGYSVSRFAAADQDRVSSPTAVPNVWRVSPHLYKFKGPDYWPNLHMILADSGRALVVDCGLFDERFLDRSLALMKERLGLKAIDAVIISHMHGDHMLQAPYLRAKWGAQVWALDNMVEKCEHPERFDYCALVESYREGLDGVRIDRVFRKGGETIDWEGFRLRVEWMPGQTEFALGVHGVIDGKTVLFTGDNIDGDPTDPEQTGHEALVARNSAILEEGYIVGAELMARVRPDLILAGHSWAIADPAPLIERYRRWSYEMRDVFRMLSPDEDYRYWFDPYWVRAEPYRVALRRGAPAEVRIHVRNFRDREQRHRVEIHTPPGITADPPAIEGALAGGRRGQFAVRLTAAPDAPPGVAIVGLDVTLDGRRYGEWFDLTARVE